MMVTEEAIALFKEKAHDAALEAQDESSIPGSLTAKQVAVTLRMVAAIYEVGMQIVAELDEIYRDMRKE